jgi:hypothetical protein
MAVPLVPTSSPYADVVDVVEVEVVSSVEELSVRPNASRTRGRMTVHRRSPSVTPTPTIRMPSMYLVAGFAIVKIID